MCIAGLRVYCSYRFLHRRIIVSFHAVDEVRHPAHDLDFLGRRALYRFAVFRD